MNKRKLSRYSAHYWALLKNLSISLIEHGKIKTTISKAKELRRYIDPLITTAKVDNLTARRRILSKLFNNMNAVNKIMKIGEMNKDRNGGYISIKRTSIRKGDCATEVTVSIIDYPKNIVKEPIVDSSSNGNDFTNAEQMNS